jgi:hypothetical protein
VIVFTPRTDKGRISQYKDTEALLQSHWFEGWKDKKDFWRFEYDPKTKAVQVAFNAPDGERYIYIIGYVSEPVDLPVFKE